MKYCTALLLLLISYCSCIISMEHDFPLLEVMVSNLQENEGEDPLALIGTQYYPHFSLLKGAYEDGVVPSAAGRVVKRHLLNGEEITPALVTLACNFVESKVLPTLDAKQQDNLFLLLDYLGADKQQVMCPLALQCIKTYNESDQSTPTYDLIAQNLVKLNTVLKKDKKVSTLILSSCGLHTLQRLMSHAHSHLTSINVSHNNLTQTYLRLFSRFKHLRDIDISNNKISELSAEELESLRPTVTVDLSNNMIQHFPACRLQWKEGANIILKGNPLNAESLLNIKGASAHTAWHKYQAALRCILTWSSITGLSLSTIITVCTSLIYSNEEQVYLDLYTLWNQHLAFAHCGGGESLASIRNKFSNILNMSMLPVPWHQKISTAVDIFIDTIKAKNLGIIEQKVTQAEVYSHLLDQLNPYTGKKYTSHCLYQSCGESDRYKLYRKIDENIPQTCGYKGEELPNIAPCCVSESSVQLPFKSTNLTTTFSYTPTENGSMNLLSVGIVGGCAMALFLLQLIQLCCPQYTKFHYVCYPRYTRVYYDPCIIEVDDQEHDDSII